MTSPNWRKVVRARLPHMPAQVAEELAQHLEDLYAEALRTGSTPEAALADATRALEDHDHSLAAETRFAVLAEQPPSTPAPGAAFSNLWTDLAYAMRMIRRQPAFAAVTIVTLVLGIGVNVAVFSVMRAALLASLPVPHPERLVSIVTWTPENGDHLDFSYPLYGDVRDNAASMATVAAYTSEIVGVSDETTRERLMAEFTTANYFDTLGIEVRNGRGFSPADERRDAAPVVVIGHALWRSMFNGDPHVAGRSLVVGDTRCEIVGVAPNGFTGFVRGQRADLWLTVNQQHVIQHDRNLLDRRTTSWLLLVGRMNDDAAPAALESKLTASLRTIASEGAANWAVRARAADGGNMFLVGGLDGPLKLLMLAVGIVLTIAAANVASLMVARSWSRVEEMAIRQSLGASRSRIARQWLTEAGVFAVLGGAGALLAGTWAARVLDVRASSAGGTLLALAIRPDAAVIGFTTLLVVISAIVIGGAPVFATPQFQFLQMMRSGLGRPTGRRAWLRSALTVVQIALSLVLVSAAALFLHSLMNLRAVDPSLRTDRTVAVAVNATLRGYDEPRGRQLYRQVLENVRQIPGVQSAALSYVLPVTSGGMRNNLPAGATTPKTNAPVEYDIVPISSGFFATLGIPLLQGRDFDANDVDTAPKVIIINERMQGTFWPSGSAVGQLFAAGEDRYVVIGVAQNSKYRNLRERPRMTMYVPLEQLYMQGVNVIARSTLPGGAAIDLLREAVRRADPAMPVYNVRTLTEHVDRSLYVDRLRATLVSTLAALALGLAGLGTYGVVSFNVARRRRELGIRLALGAQRQRILSMLLAETTQLVLVGIAIGAGLAVWLGRLIAAELFGVRPSDPVTFAASALVLIAVSLTATYIPARRAMAIDPLTSVRQE